jgi:hypothetical protein
MMLEDNKPTSKDGARSDCNREPDEAEETKIMQAPSHLSMFSAEEEDTQSWRYVTYSVKATALLI